MKTAESVVLTHSQLLAAPVAEWVRSLYHLPAVSGVGSSPVLATCETSQVMLAGVTGGFPEVLPFRPPILIGSSL